MSTPNAISNKKEEAETKNGGSSKKEEEAAAAMAETEEAQPLCRAMATTPTPQASGSKMVPHLADACSEGGQVIIINVGGQRHEVLRKNFDRYPGSRLWKLMRTDSMDEMLLLCDRYRVTASNDSVPEYFFDRNYTSFINILDAYRTGHLHVCANNCAVITRDDMAYWGIDDLLMEPCCAVKYYPEIEVCLSELEMEEDEKRKEDERQKLEDFGQSTVGKTRKYLWDLFEYPQTSRGAQVSRPSMPFQLSSLWRRSPLLQRRSQTNRRARRRLHRQV